MNSLPKYQEKQVDKSRIVQLEKGYVPPQAVDLEQAILGAMMIDSRGIDDFFEVCAHEEVFYKEQHMLIFRAIKSLVSKGQNVDLLTVSQELKTQKLLENVGGDYYLIQLTQKVTSGAHIEYHAIILLQYFIRRQVIRICQETISIAYDDAVDCFDLLDSLDVSSANISDVVNKGKTDKTFSSALDDVMKKVETLTMMDGNKLSGIETGFVALNRHFGGWQKTDFVVVGARPGMGKTSFTVSTMVEAAKAGNPVGFISMEMSTHQLTTRSVAINSNYHLNQLTKTGFEKTEYFIGLKSKLDQMRNLPIFIDDRPSLTIGEIKRKARIMKRKHDIQMLIVDYVQLAGGDGDIRIKTGETSRGLKALAKELDICVIGLSQLSRSVENRSDKRPQLHDLKESGDIEQDADIVCFLYRPEYYGIELEDEDVSHGVNTDFIVAKYREGGLATLKMFFDANKTKFMDCKPDAEIGSNGFVSTDLSNVDTSDPF